MDIFFNKLQNSSLDFVKHYTDVVGGGTHHPLEMY